jgi:hypothetical protein
MSNENPVSTETLPSEVDDAKIHSEDALPTTPTIPLTVIKNQLKTNDEMPTKLPKLAWKHQQKTQTDTDTEPTGKDLPKSAAPPKENKSDVTTEQPSKPISIKIEKGS